MSEFKVGDIVKVNDPSYSIKINTEQCEFNSIMHTSEIKFRILKIHGMRKYIVHQSGFSIHDCFIQNIETGEIYLHSLAFLQKVPITETRVKKASEIVKWLEDNGYFVRTNGTWSPCSNSCYKNSFTHHMFMYCGGKPNSVWNWLPEWLEEVEI